MKKYLIPLSTVCLLVTACSSTQKLVIMKQDKQLASCYEKKTPELQTCVTKLATKNNIVALYIISRVYKNGMMGFKHDEKKALYWGKKYLASITPLAKQGNATYELFLGNMYNQGLYGLEKDHKQALYWYHKALATFKPLADQGNPSAQIYLSGMYQVGLGVEKNQEIAIQWLRKSAISNNVIAQQKLSIVSLFSLDKNAESYAWYLIAKDNGMLDVKWGSYINSHISDSEKQQGEKLKDKLLKEIKK